MRKSFALLPTVLFVNAHALSGIKTRFVFSSKAKSEKPQLILIGGCSGTGKSTFGMSVALEQGILKCISTDTIRAVMRSFIPPDISPALHRSSYAPSSEGDDPIRSWIETCKVLEASVEELVNDALDRGVGLVIEGVSIIPSNKLIEKWENGGGTAIGCLLTVQDEEVHKSLLIRRGFISGEGQQRKDENKLKTFDRVRLIQDEMIRRSEESKWLRIEQKVEPDPLELVALKLMEDEDFSIPNYPSTLTSKPDEHVASKNDVKSKNGVKSKNDVKSTISKAEKKKATDIA
eukprot:scaffold15802_cov54-Attheya_sp.AAC.4